MANEAWLQRQTKSDEARKRYEEERLILWVTESICEAMALNGLSKADLAERLDTTRSNVTQLLSGSRNMTLRSLADLAFACGRRAQVELGPLDAGKFIEHPVDTFRDSLPRIVSLKSDYAGVNGGAEESFEKAGITVLEGEGALAA